MGGRGNNANRNSTGAIEQPQKSLAEQVATHFMRGLFEDKEIEKAFIDHTIEQLIKHPDEGSARYMNYDFYNLTGREFSSNITKIKTILNKNGYDVTVEDASHTTGGEYRISPGRGFKYHRKQTTLGKSLHFKKKGE